MSHTNHDRRVGVLELPDLVPLLEQAGFETVTGDSVAEAVKEIQQAFQQGAFPILVADSDTAGLFQWVSAVASMSGGPDVSVLTDAETAQHIDHDQVRPVPMPFSLAELVDEAGLGYVDEQWADVSWPPADETADDDQAEEDSLSQMPARLPDFSPGPENSAEHIPDFNGGTDDGSDGEQQDDMWDATAAHRQRLTSKIAQQPTRPQPQPPDPEEQSFDSQQPVQPPQPVQPIDYGRQPVEDEYAETHLPTVQQPEPPPPQHVPQNVNPGQYQDQHVQQPNIGPPAAQPRASVTPSRGPTRRARIRQCPMIFVSGAKGGIGKTTFARQLAITAASYGYRTVLIDGDLGQNNVPKFLKMNIKGYNVPTISDFAHQNLDVEDIILTADVIDSYRPQQSTPMPDNLSVVLSPERDDVRIGDVKAHHYSRVIADARERFDMVIFDSQIMKSTDEFRITRNVIIPEVRDNTALFLGLTDASDAAMDDLVSRIRWLVDEGVDRRRVLFALNRMPVVGTATKRVDQAMRQKAHGTIGIYLGIVNDDKGIWTRTNAGEPDLHNTQIDSVVYETLFRATGNQAFEKTFEHAEIETPHQGVKKPGFFARMLGRR